MNDRTRTQPIEKRRGATVAFLALADLRHEWLLNLCMILALAAVLTPLLLLLGLKNGTIQTLRHRLVEDPVYRELKPQQTLKLNAEWFSDMAARPDVAFVLPTILRGSSVVRAGKANSNQSKPMDLLPTGSGDALLLEHGGIIPGEGEVVLSADASDKLDVKTGDALRLHVSRSYRGQLETASAEFRVADVLDGRADAQARIYAPLKLVEDVEIYREGRAVPDRGWPGGTATPYPSFDGVMVIAPTGLDSVVARSLTIGTGFAFMEMLTSEDFAERTGHVLQQGVQIYDLHVLRDAAPWSAVRNVRDKLRGRGVTLIPYVREMVLLLETKTGPPLSLPVYGLSVSGDDRIVLGVPELPWDAFDVDKIFPEYARILLPADVLPKVAPTIYVKLVGVPDTPRLPLKVEGPGFDARRGIVPLELMAVLRTAMTRKIVYSANRQELILARSAYSGFRLYARSIDDVAFLHRDLRSQGIETIAKVQDIERIRILDRGLTRLFWLVAVVGIVGGTAALIASLYATVERKKRDISMLRLMGLSRMSVARFPVHQSAIVAALAAGLAIVAFHGLATVINSVFADDLGLGERICELPPQRLCLALFVTVSVAVFGSLFAAWRTNRIEPSEALRVE